MDDDGAGPEPVTRLVVIGSSAGGVEALSTLLATLPADFSAPVVVAQHLAPNRISHLGKILAARSTLPVRTVTGSEKLAAGVVYVVPAAHDVEITDHSVGILATEGGGPQPSVDLLMASAAQIFNANLIAVVLTGSGNDGAAGAQSVKALGGTVIVQNPETASSPWIPLAVPPSAVDITAELEAIGPLLADLVSGAYTLPPAGADGELRAFLDRVRERTGLDFGAYKRPTIERRLQRRMATIGLASLGDYRRYVERDPEELQRLVGSFLIKVTEFFRDPDLFDYLRDQVLPPLIAEARQRGELRIWSAGCATGEEAYTLAMLTLDLLGDDADPPPVRIYATDVAADAVEFARRGIYPEAALAEMPAELIGRHFERLEGAYEVNNRVRALVVFGEHDLGYRAPFPRIDLVLCRNVLIYFTPELQRRALQVFAFSLRQGGFLALGKSETVSPLPELFALEQPRLKIFRRIGEPVPIPVNRLFDASPSAAPGRVARPLPGGARLEAARVGAGGREGSLGRRAARLVDQLPVGVATVDRNYHIQLINIAARGLLAIHSAAVGEDLVHLAPPDLAGPLRVALDAAFRGEPTSGRYRVGPDVVDDEGRDLEVVCYAAESTSGEDAIEGAVVTVTDVTPTAIRLRDEEAERSRLAAEVERQTARAAAAVAEVRELRAANQAMAAANSRLQAEGDELLVVNEESQAAAEEIETLNEELQATNEELETLNEELQATVEELTTTNDELQARSVELQQLAALREAERAWLAAVLAGIGDAVLVVDADGRLILANDAYRQTFDDHTPLVFRDEDGESLAPEATPRRRAARGETFSLTFVGDGPEGTTRWFEASGQPFSYDGGARGGIVVIRDFTDRSLRRLQDEWLAIASHELRTPLTAMFGTLQLADRLRENPEQVAHFLAQAIRQARRLNVLVEELVEAVRFQSGRFTLRREVLDLAEVTRQAVETAHLVTDGQAMAVETGDEPILVEIDDGRIEQVVINLLANAITYAPSERPIEVLVANSNETATITVRDFGPGIATADLDRIFARYYRATPGGGRHGGLGLGLFIAQEIVTAHGGTIVATSKLGEGTTFTVRLPLAGETESG